MSTIQKMVDGKPEDIEFELNPDAVPEAVAVIVDLYRDLEKQLSVVKAALQENSATQALGDLFAVVDYFVTTERETIRQAYAEKLTAEELAELAAECGDDDDCWICPVEYAEWEAAAFAEALRIIEGA
jgi:hypothetical protein